MGTGGVLMFAFFLYLTIMWCILPFAIFGIKPLLKKQIANDEQRIKELEFLSNQNRILISQNKILMENTALILLTEEVIKE